MTKRDIVSIAFMILGLHCVVLMFASCGDLVMLLVMIGRSLVRGESAEEVVFGVGLLIKTAALAGLAYILIRRGSGLARRLIKEDTDARVQLGADWAETVLWVGLVVCGIIVLVDAVRDSAGVVMTYMQMRRSAFAAQEMGPRQPLYVATAALRTAIGVYLLVGAPHLRQFILRRMPSPNAPTKHIDNEGEPVDDGER